MVGVGELPISPVIVVVTPPKVIPLPARAPKFPAELKSTAMPKPSPARNIKPVASEMHKSIFVFSYLSSVMISQSTLNSQGRYCPVNVYWLFACW